MDKFKNKYRIPPARAQWWDYSSAGAYFITICTAHRDCFFGEIVSDRLQPAELGKLAEKLWNEIPNQFNFIQLGAFVVMPNHIHGVLIINVDGGVDGPSVDTRMGESRMGETPIVETRLIASLPPPPPSTPPPPSSTTPPPSSPPNPKPGGITGHKNPMLNENISRVIRWYKGRCAFEMRKTVIGFGWQTRFHDHIIRNEMEYMRISHYIETNPANWGKDKHRKKRE